MSLLARVCEVVSATGFARPFFLQAHVMKIVFPHQLGWLPAVGYVHWDEDPVTHLQSLLLPSLTLAVGTVPILARFLSAGLPEAVSQDYVLTARPKGLPPLTVIMKHILRNAVLPTITVLGFTLERLSAAPLLPPSPSHAPALPTPLPPSLLHP